MRLSLPSSSLFVALGLVGSTWAWSMASQHGDRPDQLVIKGLQAPAVVSDSIFVSAEGVPSGSVVRYFIDSDLVDSRSDAPYWMGGMRAGVPAGFSVTALRPGRHYLRASTLGGSKCESDPIEITVVPSIASNFSPRLRPYAAQTQSTSLDMDRAFSRTLTAAAVLSPAERAVRRKVFDMYFNWGIDLSTDAGNFQSQQLLGAAPTGWTRPVKENAAGDRERFSPDSPFYQKIPEAWPRTELPAGYLKTVQVNSTEGGDGIGYGIAYSGPTDPKREIVSQWYEMASTRVSYLFRIPSTWPAQLPWQVKGDRHMIFIDKPSETFVSTYKTSAESNGGVRALFANKPTSFDTLGDRGGSNAAGFAELPLLIRKGELTDQKRPLGHAIGGPVHRTWMARVFPASGWDYGLESSKDSCTGIGYTNTGLIPYGGIIQLDPHLDLKRLSLSLPAFRILEAMQQYGYYVMDYGCADFDIYTAISESEVNPFGGLWGENHLGIGVQNEVRKVLLQSPLYVVPPMMKKQ